MSAQAARDLRAAAEVLRQTPDAAKSVFRDVDGRTMDEVAAALEAAADAAEVQS